VKWQEKAIGSFCDTGSGGTPSRNRTEEFYGGSIPWVKSGELRESIILNASETITETGLANSSAKLVPAGAILVAMYGATVGRVGILGIEAATNQAICHIIPRDGQADTRYLFHTLQSKLPEFLSRSVGGAQPNISQEIIRGTSIPLPPVGEQRRIAAILDKADGLRRKRRAALQKLDSLLQSLFLDMFGDPVANPKGFERVLFSALLEHIDSGSSPICLDHPAGANEWGVLKLGAVTKCEFDEQEQKALPDGVEPNPELEVKAGDLLLSRKNTRDLVAACALVGHTRSRLLLPDLIFRLVLRHEAPILREFLHQLLIFPTKRREIQKLAGGSAGSMPNISKRNLLGIQIELPSTELQAKFAKRVKTIQILKARQRESITAQDSVFHSLQKLAFQGEL
jgi:type I restriction enzyme S subunit